MKPVRLGILCALATFAVAEARDIQTISGDRYREVTLSSVDATGITIMHDEGIVFLDFKNLPDPVQKEFGYDPATYADGWMQKFADRAQRELRKALAAQQAADRAKALQATAAQQPQVPAYPVYPPSNTTVVEYSVDTPVFLYGGYPISNNFPYYGGSPVYGGYPYYGPPGGYCPPSGPVYSGGNSSGGGVVTPTVPRGQSLGRGFTTGGGWAPAQSGWKK